MIEGRPSRGGCWSHDPQHVRVARCTIEDPDNRCESRGIRLIEVIEDSALTSVHRVNRGGSWCNGQRYARVANRNSNIPGDRYYDLGIRLVEIIEDGKEDPT